LAQFTEQLGEVELKNILIKELLLLLLMRFLKGHD